jgi:hypothetical protein
MLNDLIPDSYYRVELRAHNSIGYSIPTNVYLKTARGESDGLQTFETFQAGFGSSNSVASCLHSCCVLIVCLVQFTS